MKRWIGFALVFLLGYILSGAHSPIQADDSTEKLSNASIATSEAQTKRIQRELRHQNNHNWAGEYFFGDGLGVNVSLTLAPESGFVFSWHGCLGLYDLNYGDVALSNGTVKLLFKYPNTREGFQGIAPELLPVRWGERHYLIPADSIVQFTNAVNAGLEPNGHGGRSYYFLLKRGDENKPVTGQPNLPNEYLNYLLTKPIRAEIVSIEETLVEGCCRITSVALDMGSADGLKKGMELHVYSPSRVFESAIVTSVGEHWAQAVIKQLAPADPPPSVTWKLSTRLH